MPEKRDYQKHLKGMTAYGGETWWAITYDAVVYVLRFVSENPKIVHFFKHTKCPDEMFFHTILGNSHFKEKAIRGLTYTDWSARKKSPAFITQKHIQFLKDPLFHLSKEHNLWGHKDFLFARKFPDDSENLIKILKNTTDD